MRYLCLLTIIKALNMIRNVIIALLVFSFFTAFANDSIKIVKLKSKVLNETREVMIRLPENYSKDTLKSYPVLVTLNDKDNFNWASNIVAIQASRYGVEDMIVVGLPHNGNYSDDNFPYKEDSSLELSAQSQNYSKFIREEALVYIENNYRTNGGRFIIGHSLSGLFVLQLLMQYPESFSSYVVLSPSVQYAPQMATALRDFLLKNEKLTNQIFLSIGEMEHSLIQTEFRTLSQTLKKNVPNTLNWTVVYLDNTDHLLSAYKGIYDGLAWIYKDWYINESKMRENSLNDYINHYQLLSQKLNYNIKPREKHLMGFSWFAENKLNDLDAAITAIKAGLYFYPDSLELKKRLTELNKTKD